MHLMHEISSADMPLVVHVLKALHCAGAINHGAAYCRVPAASSLDHPGREPPTLRVLADYIRLNERRQIILAAGLLRPHPTHTSSPERLPAHQGSRGITVDVQVADLEFLAHRLDVARRPRVQRARQLVVRVIGQIDGVVDFARLGDGEHGTKDLRAPQVNWRVPVDGEDVRGHVVPPGHEFGARRGRHAREDEPGAVFGSLVVA
mmetsp:Transcript_3255/g.13186  ORF Transcript_3255/g.13186 Transcript_3255/m.13186 type:complete len:205 (-) Transcript_3255:763-1377(-)